MFKRCLLLSLSLILPTLIQPLSGRTLAQRGTASAAQKSAAGLSAAEQEAAAQLKTETIREVTTALASREMEGRGMAQPGGDKAAKYLADRFARAGLKPGGDASTYYQQLKIKIETPLPETSFKVGDTVFQFKRDFVLAPYWPLDSKDVSGRLVFVGYGVVSDELKRDDLAGIDVKGKIVVVLGGKPGNVKADVWERAAKDEVVFGRLFEKGAAGIVLTYDRQMWHSYPYSWIKAYLSRRRIYLENPPPDLISPVHWIVQLPRGEFGSPPIMLVSESTAGRIFATQGMTFAQVKQRALAGRFVSRNLNLQASITARLKHEEGTSNNVIGVLEGSDAKLKNEAVIYSAHYDAYGKDYDGTIYPGAADNALGVGKLVAIAEAFARAKQRPRRSVIFIAWTGEEYGLLGSEHWLQHPTWPLEKVAANINYDGLGMDAWGKLAFVLDLGFNNSDLNEVIKGVAAATDIEVVPDMWPGEEVFFRSDHYAFIKKGIPALFLVGGPASITYERVVNWEATSYHMATDTVQPNWNWEGARTLAVVGLLTGMRIANQESMPQWKASSPYNRPRGTTQPPPPQ
jgi:hypothetical protein